RIVNALGDSDPPLSAIDQDFANRLRDRLLRPHPKPATVIREIISPISTILRHAVDRGWTEPVRLATPEVVEGRTHFLLPHEAEQLVAAAAPHLCPLLLFLIGTGARASEALELEWRDVDLVAGRAIVWAAQAKTRRRRNLLLPPRVIDALSEVPDKRR